MAKIKLLTLLLLLPYGLFAQTNRYMVFFSDKDNSTYSTEDPLSFLSQAALDRRAKASISITMQDLPVNATYVQGVKDLGVDVFFTSRWMNAALIQTDESKITDIESLIYVDSVNLVAPNIRLLNGRKNRSQRKQGTLVENSMQLSMLGLSTLHDEGINGEGVTIAFFDAGYAGVNEHAAFEHIFTDNQISATLNLVENSTDVYRLSSHGTRVFSTVAAKLQNDYFGVATASQYQLYITEDEFSEHRIEEYNWLIAAEKADSAGVDIIASSVGYNTFDSPSTSYTYEDLDGETTIITQAANIATQKGMLVVTSAGNSGNDSWRFITAPADAKNILAVGSVNSDGSRSSFSSFGPTADGRTKPEVMALGAGVSLVNSSGIVTTASGTSFAAPQVAGLAALVLQMNPTFTNLELRTFILNLGLNASNPNNEIGYGIPTYNSVLSIGPEFDSETLKVYPNPVYGSEIQLLLEGANTIGKYQIFNSNGQLALAGELYLDTNEPRPIFISTLQKGLYFLQLSVADQLYIRKIIKD